VQLDPGGPPLEEGLDDPVQGVGLVEHAHVEQDGSIEAEAQGAAGLALIAWAEEVTVDTERNHEHALGCHTPNLDDLRLELLGLGEHHGDAAERGPGEPPAELDPQPLGEAGVDVAGRTRHDVLDRHSRDPAPEPVGREMAREDPTLLEEDVETTAAFPQEAAQARQIARELEEAHAAHRGIVDRVRRPPLGLEFDELEACRKVVLEPVTERHRHLGVGGQGPGE